MSLPLEQEWVGENQVWMCFDEFKIGLLIEIQIRFYVLTWRDGERF